MSALRLICLVFLGLLARAAGAETVRLTIYDDGLSCPAECDAHVVFHATLNGTEFAHLPATTNGLYTKCIAGQLCRICLESGGKQCLNAMYRGSGPAPRTFDFTPRFYEAACAGPPEQRLLAAKCAELNKAAKALDGRKNCIADPDDALCRSIMEGAIEAHAQDRIEYEKCIVLGESDYNDTQVLSKRRSLRCAYELKATGGPNSKGTTWRRLLPGACRNGTFVGRDGLDCCSGAPFTDGPLGRECNAFYPSLRIK